MKLALLAGLLLGLVAGAGGAARMPAPASIAFVHAVPGAPEIVVMSSDGSERRVVARGRDPAWSPDGSRIAFERGSEVFVVAPDGTGEHRLGAGAEPAWSPDGSRLAFADGGAVWVAGADGMGRRRLTVGSSPTWSPDAAEIAFARGGDVWAVRVDGGAVRRLTSGKEIDSTPAWSPDGTRIAFTRRVGAAAPRLATVGADGSRLQNTSAEFPELDPAWAAGGSLVYSSNGEICVVDAAGKAVRLTHRTDGSFNVAPAPEPAAAFVPAPVTADRGGPPACGDSSLYVLEVGVSHRPSGPRQVIVYTIEFENNTPAPAHEVWLLAGLPRPIRLVKLAATGAFCRRVLDGLLECGVGDLDLGQRATIELRFRPLAYIPPSFGYSVFGDASADSDDFIDLESMAVVSCSIGGTDGDDVIVGTRARDEICGFDGDDVIRAGGGRDWVDAGAGRDRVDGATSRDSLSGAEGDDYLVGGSGDDAVGGGAGADVLVGGPGRDTLHGHGGPDRLEARDGRADKVDGGGGHDHARIDPGLRDEVHDVEVLLQ